MIRIAACIAAVALATTASAQTSDPRPAPTQPAPTPAPTVQSGLGALGGLLGGGGGGLSNLGSAGVGNVAGLLGYCVRNKLSSGAGVASILGGLTGKPGVTTSDGYAAGQQGLLQGGNGKALSLDGVKAGIRTRVCDLVLRRAKAFL